MSKAENNTKKFPAVALGTWSWGVGAVGGDQVFGNHLGTDELKPVFERAMEEGLNLWDSAVVYGMGASEEILGNFTKDYPRENVIISTKFTPPGTGPIQWRRCVSRAYSGFTQIILTFTGFTIRRMWKRGRRFWLLL